eukprot:g4597.t1
MSYEAIKYLRKEGKKVSVLRTARAIGRLSELSARRVKVNEEEIEREMRFFPRTSIEAKVNENVSRYEGKLYTMTLLRVDMIIDSCVTKYKHYITLCTHCSVDRMSNLIELTEAWNGPLSVAVYVRTEREKEIVSQNQKLRQRKNLALCIVFDRAKKKEYPINALRNIALSRARSDIVLNIDVDLIPSKRLYQRLTEKYVYSNMFQGPQSKKIAWIVPAFELHSLRSNIPRTRRHLRLMWSAKLVSGFQMSHYPPGHRATNHARWLTPLDSKHHITNGYDVNYEEGFEPYVLCRRENMPIFDERFQGYGKNKTIHSFLLHHCGYTFRVLPPLGFLVSRIHPRSSGWIRMYHPFCSNKITRIRRNCLYEKVKREIIVKRKKQIKITSSPSSSCCRRHLLIVAPSATGKSHFVRTFYRENVRVVDADKLVGSLIGWDRLALIPDTKYKNRVMWEELFLWLSLQTIPTALLSPPYGGISELSRYEGIGFICAISVVLIEEQDHRSRLNSRKMDISNGIVSSSKPNTWEKIRRHRDKLERDMDVLKMNFEHASRSKSFRESLDDWFAMIGK